MEKNDNLIGTRISTLRKALDLSMDAFGSNIGVTKSSISKLENGENIPAERTIKLICSVYNVNDFWLRDGIGDMFISIPDTIIDELAIQYDLDDFWKDVLRKFLGMSDAEKTSMEKYLKSIFNIK